jgi:hypothetical protein
MLGDTCMQHTCATTPSLLRCSCKLNSCTKVSFADLPPISPQSTRINPHSITLHMHNAVQITDTERNTSTYRYQHPLFTRLIIHTNNTWHARSEQHAHLRWRRATCRRPRRREKGDGMRRQALKRRELVPKVFVGRLLGRRFALEK